MFPKNGVIGNYESLRPRSVVSIDDESPKRSPTSDWSSEVGLWGATY
jgi:hypothetical protein